MVSTAKVELDAITDHFGVDVDNPMSILTQGMAPRTLSVLDSHSARCGPSIPERS